MSLSVSRPKDPVKVAAGQSGARARWGDERRIVRLDSLTGPQRALIVALVENMGPESTKKRTPALLEAGVLEDGHAPTTPR